jgi:hypothetical protein
MDFDTRIKLAIYSHFAQTGSGPTSGDKAELVGSDVQSVLGAIRLFHCLVPAAKWWDDIVYT